MVMPETITQSTVSPYEPTAKIDEHLPNSDASIWASAAERAAPTSPAQISAFYQAWLVAILFGGDLVTILTTLLWVAPFGSGHPWVILLADIGAAICLQNAGFSFGLYAAATSASLRRSIGMILGLCLCLVGVALLSAFDFTAAGLGRLALTAAAALLVSACLRLAVAAWLKRHAPAVAERMLLVGTPRAVSELLAFNRASCDRQRLVGMIVIGDGTKAPIEVIAALDRRCADLPAAEDFWRIREALREHTRKIDRVVILQGDLGEGDIVSTLQRLDHMPCEIALAPPLSVVGKTDDPLGQKNCAILCPVAITPWGLACKRTLDVPVTLLLLAIIAPLLIIIAIMVKLGSPGPALFRQERWGRNNEIFTIYKFRTMWSHSDAADGSIQAIRSDKRITPLGAILRRTSLDELPQLLNVLNGTMSLVGPRPHPVDLNTRYLGVIDRYAARHRVVPGMTGLAQINGYRGETSSTGMMERRLEFDLEYIRARSFGADILILLKTAGAVFRGDNAC